jgi:hypothetical protein
MRKSKVEDSMQPLDEWAVKLGDQCRKILEVPDLPAKQRAMVTDIMNKVFLQDYSPSWKQFNAIDRIHACYVKKT